MNKGLLASLAVLVLFIGGSFSHETVDTATKEFRGCKDMSSKQEKLEAIDKQTQELRNGLEQGEKFRLTLKEVGDLISKGEETRKLLQSCVDSPEYARDYANDRIKPLHDISERLIYLCFGVF